MSTSGSESSDKDIREERRDRRDRIHFVVHQRDSQPTQIVAHLVKDGDDYEKVCKQMKDSGYSACESTRESPFMAMMGEAFYIKLIGGFWETGWIGLIRIRKSLVLVLEMSTTDKSSVCKLEQLWLTNFCTGVQIYINLLEIRKNSKSE